MSSRTIIFAFLGRWSTGGCETNNTDTEFICSCNHLSFFAVLVVNPYTKCFLSVACYILYRICLYRMFSNQKFFKLVEFTMRKHMIIPQIQYLHFELNSKYFAPQQGHDGRTMGAPFNASVPEIQAYKFVSIDHLLNPSPSHDYPTTDQQPQQTHLSLVNHQKHFLAFSFLIFQTESELKKQQ